MRLRAKPTFGSSRQTPLLRTCQHLRAIFPHVQAHSFSASSSQEFGRQAQREPLDLRDEEEEDDSTHIAGKWGELAEVLFPEVLALDEDEEDEPPEGYQDANAVPADVAAHLGRLLSNTSSRSEDALQPAFPSSSFCINCCSPLTGMPSSSSSSSSSSICLECGWSDEHGQAREAANSPLLDPTAPLKWSTVLQAQQQQQQQQKQQQQQQPLRQGLHPGVALGFHERMLLHRASLPPFPERPERLTAILTRLLQQDLLSLCTLQPAREATLEELHAVHSPDLVQGLAAAAPAEPEMGAYSHTSHSSSRSSSNSSASNRMDAGLLACIAAAAAARASAALYSVNAGLLACIAAAAAARGESLLSHAVRAAHAAQLSALDAHDDASTNVAPTPMSSSSGAATTSSGNTAAVSGDAVDTCAALPSTNSTLDDPCASPTAEGMAAAAGPSSVASLVHIDAQVLSTSPERSSSATSAANASATTAVGSSATGADASVAHSDGVLGSGSSALEVKDKEAESDEKAGLPSSSATTAADTYASHSDGVRGSGLSGFEVKDKKAGSDEHGAAAAAHDVAQDASSSAQEESSSEQEQRSSAQVEESSSAQERKGKERKECFRCLRLRGHLSGSNPRPPESVDASAQVPFYGGTLAPDTLVSAHTFQAASLAAGCSAQLAQSLARGEVGSAFALVRPHGHHADYSTSQSGCYFNNAAVAARAAQHAGMQRVLIVDWDVHHGQGTEALFAEDDTVMVVSLHRADEEFYPGTGQVTDVGVGDGRGYTLNIPWQDNMVTDGDYLQCMLHVVLPVAHHFQPDMVVVSAGFDGAQGDFFGQTRISPACYAHMTHMLLGLAPCLFVLEGGYNLDATARCVEACLRVMLGARPPRLEDEYDGTKRMSKAGVGACMNAMQVQGEFWPSLATLNLNGWMAVIREHQEAASSGDEGAEAETETETEDEEWQ